MVDLRNCNEVDKGKLLMAANFRVSKQRRSIINRRNNVEASPELCGTLALIA